MDIDLKNAFYLVDGTWGEEARLNAGNKARDDVSAILHRMGLVRVVASLPVDGSAQGALGKLREHWVRAREIERSTAHIPEGAVLVVQFPLVLHTIAFSRILRSMQRRGIRVVLLLHDVELLRFARAAQTGWFGRLRIAVEEKRALSQCDAIIVHNESMAQQLSDELDLSDKKMVPLEIFDYLCDQHPMKAATDKNDAVVVAGNLSPHKAGYLYELARAIPVRAYGVGIDRSRAENIDYRGSFGPEKLPSLLRGSFGLVWDGPDTTTCSGAFGEYLKVNNPHKTSLYLAAGLPVIIWEEAALAPLLKESGAGLTISSLSDIPEAIEHVSEDGYAKMILSARRLGERIRAGYYTERALLQALEVIA